MDGFWDFALTSVRVGGVDVSTSNLALLDTGSSYIIGPKAAVAHIAQLNNAKCFTMSNDDTEPQLTSCSQGTFDAAVIDCDQPFFNLEFVADDRVYVLEKEDLIIQVGTSFGDACILRLVGNDIPVSDKNLLDILTLHHSPSLIQFYQRDGFWGMSF